MNKLRIAIVGATGLVGENILEILAERQFPVAELHLLASAASVDKILVFRNKNYYVEDLAEFDFKKVDLAFFTAGSAVSKQYVPKAVAAGCKVIDNTSEFRLDPNIPLLVPEVNSSKDSLDSSIIANPNCSTIQLVVALKPLYEAVGIDSIIISTYQAVSGSGREAITELAGQCGELLNGRTVTPKVYPEQIAFNVLPQIDSFATNGFTGEELKMIYETKKILADQNLHITATAVRVPVFFGHSLAVRITTREELSAAKARELLSAAKGVIVVDDISQQEYPTALRHAAGKDEVYVGRIRNDLDNNNALNLWIVADNVRKGAALNSIQIAEMLVSAE